MWAGSLYFCHVTDCAVPECWAAQTLALYGAATAGSSRALALYGVVTAGSSWALAPYGDVTVLHLGLWLCMAMSLLVRLGLVAQTRRGSVFVL